MQAEGGLSGRELTFARNIARYWIAKSGAKVSSASVTATAGKEPSHNVGDACMSGRLLYIRLIGEFPNTAVSPRPGTAEEVSVRSMHITADAKTGRACLVGVGIKGVTPDHNAVILPIH